MTTYIKTFQMLPTMKTLDSDKAGKKEEKVECACFTCPSQEACKAAQEAEKAAPAEEKIDFSNLRYRTL
jgi:hypothetical protein